MSVEHLSNGNDDGVTLGQSASDKISLYNVTPVVQPSGAAQADQGAMTGTAPAAPTAYSAHASGAVAVTSNAATDLDTTAAALETLRDEVAAIVVIISAIVDDVAALDVLLTATRTADIAVGVMKGSA